MVRVNNTLVCGAGFFRFSWFSWPPTHYRVSDIYIYIYIYIYSSIAIFENGTVLK